MVFVRYTLFAHKGQITSASPRGDRQLAAVGRHAVPRRPGARSWVAALGLVVACGPTVGTGEPSDGDSTGTATTTDTGPTETSTADDDTASSSGTEGVADETTGPLAGCGNGQIDPGESCDLAELDGVTCETLVGYGEQLQCTERCTFDISGCTPTEMTLIPGGEFEMGSNRFSLDELPARTVQLDPFFIDTVETTVAEYEACVDAGVCPAPAPGIDCNWGVPGQGQRPINCVSWFDADTYCGWVDGPNSKRLPTEAEWEKAARGTDGFIYPWGDAPPPTCAHVVMNEGVGGCGEGTPLVGGSRPMGDSPYGVHDMAGNMWNWVNDWYAPYDVAEVVNPTGPASGRSRIVRGGGWDTVDINWFRTTARNPHTPDMANRNIGFRCAQDVALLGTQ